MVVKSKVKAKKPADKKAPAKKVLVKKAAVKKAPAKAVAKKPAKKVLAKKPVTKAAKVVNKPVKKTVTKKAPLKKVAAKVKKTAVAKKIVKKVVAKKVAVKKAPVKKIAVKEVVVKKAPAKKVVAPKAAAKKSVALKKPEVQSVIGSKAKTVAKPAAAPVSKPKPKAFYPSLPKPVVSTKTIAEKIEAKKAAPMILNKAQINNKVMGPVQSIAAYEANAGEEYMNQSQVAHFAHVLQAWRREVMEGVDRTVGHMREDAEYLADLNDRATQEEEFNLELRTRDRERKLLKKIEQAMQRIDEGEFGYCEACGVEIGLPRLEVRPTATLCIDCKTVEELREKQLTL